MGCLGLLSFLLVLVLLAILVHANPRRKRFLPSIADYNEDYYVAPTFEPMIGTVSISSRGLRGKRSVESFEILERMEKDRKFRQRGLLNMKRSLPINYY